MDPTSLTHGIQSDFSVLQTQLKTKSKADKKTMECISKIVQGLTDLEKSIPKKNLSDIKAVKETLETLTNELNKLTEEDNFLTLQNDKKFLAGFNKIAHSIGKSHDLVNNFINSQTPSIQTPVEKGKGNAVLHRTSNNFMVLSNTLFTHQSKISNIAFSLGPKSNHGSEVFKSNLKIFLPVDSMLGECMEEIKDTIADYNSSKGVIGGSQELKKRINEVIKELNKWNEYVLDMKESLGNPSRLQQLKLDDPTVQNFREFVGKYEQSIPQLIGQLKLI